MNKNHSTSSKPIINLSIIIPVYKTESMLTRCLNSVISYLKRNMEIIVVSDGPSEKCSKIISKYQNKYENITFIQHPHNMGIFQTRLTGAKHAKGTFLIHLDSDDYVENDIYSKAYAHAINTNSDIVLFNVTEETTVGSRFQYSYNKVNYFQNYTGKLLLNEILKKQAIAWIWHISCNKIVKRTLYADLLKYFSDKRIKLNLYDDLILSVFLYTKIYNNNCISAITDNGYIYVTNETSTTRDQQYTSLIKKSLDTIQAIRIIHKILKNTFTLKENKKDFTHTKKRMLTSSHLIPPTEFKITNYYLYIKLFFKHLCLGNFDAILSITEKKAKKILIKKILYNEFKEISIFGTGNLARNIAIAMKSHGIKVNFFFSTHSDLKKIDNIPVKTFEHQNSNENIIIASIGSYKEITNSLKEEYNINAYTI